MLRTLCLAVLGFVAFAADDLPKAASDALVKSKTANAKTFIAWKQAVEKDRAALTKTLEGILATESKKKNNDAAVTAIKAKLDELKNDDWVATAIKEQSADADDLLGEMMTEKEVMAALDGTWYVKNYTNELCGKIVYDAKAKTLTMFKVDKLTKAIITPATDFAPFKVAKVDGKWMFLTVWNSTVEFKQGNKIMIDKTETSCYLTREK